MKLNKLTLAALTIGSMGWVGFADAAQTITLAPSAGNGSPVTKTICGTGCTYTGSYVVSDIQTTLASLLTIDTANSGVGGVTSTWTETGVLPFTSVNSGASTLGMGRGAAVAGGFPADSSHFYDIYGLFSGNGGGIWGTTATSPSTFGQFSVTSISSFSIDIWASPSSNTTPITVGTGGTVAQGINDFLLGTATFAGSFGGTNAQIDGLGGATTQLTASFVFAAANINYTGVGGFFQAPVPFTVVFSGSGSANSGQATYTTDSSGVHITAGVGATGNLTPIGVVPEPGALSLAGIALLGAAFAARRKVRVTA